MLSTLFVIALFISYRIVSCRYRLIWLIPHPQLSHHLQQLLTSLLVFLLWDRSRRGDFITDVRSKPDSVKEILVTTMSSSATSTSGQSVSFMRGGRFYSKLFKAPLYSPTIMECRLCLSALGFSKSSLPRILMERGGGGGNVESNRPLYSSILPLYAFTVSEVTPYRSFSINQLV
jgi:hypothetical protein